MTVEEEMNTKEKENEKRGESNSTGKGTRQNIRKQMQSTVHTAGSI
jgi:hypothetical protein